MKKTLKILTISFLPLILLCSCDRIIKNLTADQIHIMTVAYYETYVLGNETDQRTIDDIKRYEDLLKKAEKDGDTLALTVWEKYDDIGDWNIELEKGVFSFANEFLILAYRFRKNEFITVENAVLLDVISYGELKECFMKLDEYRGFWSDSEGLNSNNGRLALEYKNQNNVWVGAINFFDSIQNIAGLSTSKANPGKYRYDFPYGTKSFRYVSESENPTNTSTNKGRVIIGPVSVIFSTNDESVSNMYVTIFAHHNGSSSSNNFGHGWIQIFNNSTRPIPIGNYILLPYEGLTMGLWNNTGQHGVHYNLEYYRDLTIAVERTNNSSSSSSSSSSSGSSGDSIDSSPQWSQGSAGVSSWLSNELTQPQIVSIATGRVSLTKVVSTSLATNFAPIISAHNSSWSIDYNCADFAIAIWNSISDDHIGRDLIQTPANQVEKITSQDYDQTNRYLLGSCQNVGYFDNDDIFHYSLD